MLDQKDLLPSKWGGDLFNTMTSVADNYLGGMIYLSRMADTETKRHPSKYNELKDLNATSLETEKTELVGGEGDKNKRETNAKTRCSQEALRIIPFNPFPVSA